MNKTQRKAVYDKFSGRCAYCGKKIEYKNMQVDHIVPKRRYTLPETADCNRIDNLNPSCRRCNHYKRGSSLGSFRATMLTLHERVRDIYICKVAEDYGIIEVKPWDGRFYFERTEKP